MDKLSALESFVATDDGASFSAAARHHDVSVAAVAKLIGALEAELNLRLIERGAQGVSLTAAGAAYLEVQPDRGGHGPVAVSSRRRRRFGGCMRHGGR